MARNSGAIGDLGTASTPQVWIVNFDRLPADEVCDRLDLNSTFFEQYMLQDLQSSAEAADLFGGDSAFLKLAEAMAASGQLVSLISLEANAEESAGDGVRDSVALTMRQCGVPLHSVVSCDCGESEVPKQEGNHSSAVKSAASANLVWIEANAGMRSGTTNSLRLILDFVEHLIEGSGSLLATSPILIVTCRRGDDREVHKPLQSTLSDSRMHVPLWIRHGARHACRVQALTGSFDLLPTIAEFLGHAPANENVSLKAISAAPDEQESAVSEVRLSSDSTSLVRLCGAPQVCPDRLLKLSGDGWTGARTEHYLLVVSDLRNTESAGCESEESSRRLFVKPDDRFNVSDVSGTYATVAEELSSLLE